MKKKHKIELVAPAGNIEKLRIAFLYGADAVYIGYPGMSLRAYAEELNFGDEEIISKEAKKAGKKLYIALNAYLKEADLKKAEAAIKKINVITPDAIIVSDPGMIKIARNLLRCGIKIHLSTQANTLNSSSVLFWKESGVDRIILGREVTLKDIRMIKKVVPDMELEIFCHGAMCVSYSGRCLLSSVMTGKSANEGKCTHPCRWKYYLVEEKRPGEYFQIESFARGSYILNSKDLNMIDYITEIAKAGVDSIKIEGRMKSLYYIACVVRAYRNAVDCYHAGKKRVPKKIIEELEKISHRKYTTGFYVDRDSDSDMQIADTSAYERKYDFLGIVEKSSKNTVTLEVRNKIRKGDSVEVIGPDIGCDREETINLMFDQNGGVLKEANPGMKVKVRFNGCARPGDLVRKKNE